MHLPRLPVLATYFQRQVKRKKILKHYWILFKVRVLLMMVLRKRKGLSSKKLKCMMTCPIGGCFMVC